MDPWIVFLVFLYSTIFLFGFTGNLTMVLVTVFSRNLRSSCNILIGACCFFDLILFTDILAFIYSIFVDTPQDICFYINIPADFGAFASNACVLMVGIDRLLAITNPQKYKFIEMNKKKYLTILLSFPIAYASILLWIGFGQRNPDKTVICLLPESLGHAYDLFAMTSFIINLFVPPIYIYVYRKIKKVQIKTSTQSVFKSLFITVILVVSGWMTTDLCGVLSVVIPMPADIARYIQLYCGAFIFTSSSLNAFVYYRISKDYRLAIRLLFGWDKPGNRWMKSTVGNQPTIDGSTHQRKETNSKTIHPTPSSRF